MQFRAYKFAMQRIARHITFTLKIKPGKPIPASRRPHNCHAATTREHGPATSGTAHLHPAKIAFIFKQGNKTYPFFAIRPPAGMAGSAVRAHNGRQPARGTPSTRARPSPGGKTPAGRHTERKQDWGKRQQAYPDRESNSDLLFRRELFYPLNYQGNPFFSLQRYSKLAEKQKKCVFIFAIRPIWCNFVV